MTILDFGVKSVKDLMLDVTLERANAGKNIVNEQNSQSFEFINNVR